MDKTSRLVLNRHLLSRCGSAWMNTGSITAPMRPGAPLCRKIRQVSTTGPKKAQGVKEAVKVMDEAAPKGKKLKASAAAKTRKASTKAASAPSVAPKAEEAKVPAKAKTPRPSKSNTKATTADEAKATVPTKKTGSKSDIATATKTSEPAAAPAPTPATSSPAASSTTTTTTTTQQSAAASTTRSASTRPDQASASKKAAPTTNNQRPASHTPRYTPDPTPRRPVLLATGDTRPKVDTSSPEYKQAAWKWTSTIIALPILLVTSWALYDRLVLGNHRSLEPIRTKLQAATGAAPDDAEAGDA